MIYAISDIHGCLDAFEEKLKLIELKENDKFILLGDYIDYGPQSGKVIRRIIDLQKEYGSDSVIALKGNHEAYFLEWIDAYTNPGRSGYSEWLRTDSDDGLNTFLTLVSKTHAEELDKISRMASFEEINRVAAKMILDDSEDIIKWMKSLPLIYETPSQIFVHAGVDEEAGDLWRVGTSEEIFLWKYPHTTGTFLKTVIAGHIGTGSIVGDENYHDHYYDGESHYYIDGSVYKPGGKLILLVYDPESGEYYFK